MSRDHVYPKSKGGRGIQNKVLACKDCNKWKANLSIEDFKTLAEQKLDNFLGRDSVAGKDITALEIMQKLKIDRLNTIIQVCNYLIDGGTIREGWHKYAVYKYVDCNTQPIKLEDTKMNQEEDKCFYCERKFNVANYGTNKPCAKTVDHIIPLSKSGNNKAVNRIDSCTECNHLKASLTLDEFIGVIQNLIDTGTTYKTIPDSRYSLIVKKCEALKIYVSEKGEELYRPSKQEVNIDTTRILDRLMSMLPVKLNIKILKETQKEKQTVKELPFYDNPILKDEHQLFLQQQTPEQFQIAKKHGWRFAKMITEPSINFNYE